VTGVDELIAFVRTCLDDDEATAAIISSGGYMAQTWHAGPDGPGHVGVLLFAEDRVIGDPPEAVERYDEPFAIVIGGRAEHRHIARWDPARVLAEVEAKRAILAHHELHAEPFPCRTMKLLAQPYADRPGWREEWRLEVA
jgi:hypothetical protein